jgi:hypothetical protein
MAGKQADGCQLGTLNMARIGFSLNNFFFSVNSFRWVHLESFQRRIPIYQEPDGGQAIEVVARCRVLHY